MAETQGDENSTQRSAGARLAARRAAKAARKASSRGTGPEIPDEVTQGVADASSWLDEHQKGFWGSLAVGAILLTVFGTFMLSTDKVDHDASRDLTTGIETIMAPLGDPPVDDDGSIERFASSQERATRALEQFRATQTKFPGSTAALFAALGEANALLALGKPKEAQAIYAKLTRAEDAPSVLQWQTLEGLAFSLEAQEHYADAAKRFEELGKLQTGQFHVPADYHMARMAMALGKRDDAVKKLTDLIKADANRKDADGPRFESVIDGAGLLLQEWGAGPVTPPPARGSLPTGAPGASGAPAIPAGGGLTQQMIDSLRKQLKTKAGGAAGDKPGLTPEIVEALQAQVDRGEGDDVTISKMLQPPKAAPPVKVEPAAAEPVLEAKALKAKTPKAKTPKAKTPKAKTPKTETKPEPAAAAPEVEATPKAEAKAEPEAKPEPEAKAEPEAKPEPKPEPKPAPAAAEPKPAAAAEEAP